MIVVDTSALLAIVLTEPAADRCLQTLRSDADLVVSAGTLLEIALVARCKDVEDGMSALMASLSIRVVAVDEAMARVAIDAALAYGKGRHPASLNYGDCFSYAAAKFHDCPLLYVGNDFSQTDIRSALGAP